MSRYNLQSIPAVFAPGVISTAIRLFEEGEKEIAREIVKSWDGLPSAVVEDLLSKKLPYRVEGETVVVETPEASTDTAQPDTQN